MSALPFRARLKPDRHAIDYLQEEREDVDRIVAAFAAAGIELAPEGAGEAWRRVADEFAANWYGLGSDDDARLRQRASRYLDIEPNPSAQDAEAPSLP